MGKICQHGRLDHFDIAAQPFYVVPVVFHYFLHILVVEVPLKVYKEDVLELTAFLRRSALYFAQVDFGIVKLLQEVGQGARLVRESSNDRGLVLTTRLIVEALAQYDKPGEVLTRIFDVFEKDRQVILPCRDVRTDGCRTFFFFGQLHSRTRGVDRHEFDGFIKVVVD